MNEQIKKAVQSWLIQKGLSPKSAVDLTFRLPARAASIILGEIYLMDHPGLIPPMAIPPVAMPPTAPAEPMPPPTILEFKPATFKTTAPAPDQKPAT